MMTREIAIKALYCDICDVDNKAIVDKIYDDFEKEIKKIQKEYYIKGSNDCHNTMKGSFSIKSITNGYNCDTWANNHLGHDSYTCVNCQEFYFKNWEKQDD